MAIVKTTQYGSFNSSSNYWMIGDIAYVTDSQIGIFLGGRPVPEAFFYGDFHIDDYGNVTGHVHSFVGGSYGVVRMLIEDIGMRIEDILPLVTGGDSKEALEKLLGGDDYIDVREYSSSIGRHKVFGFDGDDFIVGSVQSDELSGGAGDDEIYAGNRADVVNGGSGSDSLFGEFGDDIINGGVGDDLIIGGDGVDTAVFGVSSADANIYRSNEAIIVISAEGFDILYSVEYLSFIDREIPKSDFDEFGTMFTGSDEVDVLFGSAASDVFSALSGDDTITGFGGNDQLDGGEGFDTAVYSGNQASYTVQLSASGVTVSDRRVGMDGTDELVDFENLRFADGYFNIDIRTGAADLPAEDFAAIVELYIAYFNRAPASKGLLYWADRLEDDMPLPKIAESFFVQPETQNTYAEYLDENGKLNDTEAFVKAVFNNVLGRDPYGPYWINELDNNPAITPAIFILAVLNGAKAPTGGAEDREFLANKTDIGIYFSAIKGLSDYDDTISVMNLFDGSEESVDAAVTAMDAIYEEALDPNTGEFLMPLVGVVDDPFAVA